VTERIEESLKDVFCPFCESPKTILVNEYDDEDDPANPRYLGTWKECLMCWKQFDKEDEPEH
jgi:hypothetical protein